MAIVVGYIPTPEGKAALDRAVSEARMRDARLFVVNSKVGGRDFDMADLEEFQSELNDVRLSLEAAGVSYEMRDLVRGNDPSEDLISVAEDVSADMIVIGLRKRSPVGKLVLGSNAQQILLDAPCAVLAVKVQQN